MFLGLDKKPSGKLAVVDAHGIRLTYGELVDEVERVKGSLSGRTLAFCLCRNVAGCAVGYLAMVDAGVVPVMLPASMDAGFLGSLYEEYRPSLVWAPSDAELPETIAMKPLCETLGYRLLSTDEEPCPMDERLQLCMTTSGSTGSPKLVRYKAGNLEANARNVARAFGWTPEDRTFADLGMNYTMGLNIVNAHLWAGATVLLTDANLLASDYWDYMRGERATNLCGVPFTFDVYRRLRFERMELPDLRTVTQGGGRLTEQRFRELAEWAGSTGRRFIASFGTTETSARCAVLPPDLALEKTCSIGRALPEGELFLVGPDGLRVDGEGAEGELCVSGPNVTMGYARRRDDLLLGDEWQGTYRTGDLARRDADGCYYVTGRLSRFLKLLGHRVSLDECERILSQDLGVTCACVGDDGGMVVFAEGDADLASVRAHLSTRLSLRPSLFDVREIGTLPRNNSGKIAYGVLREAQGLCNGE